MCICYADAQTQQGIVKTRGRMINGQLVAGQKLAGATITLNFGNALVSGSRGGFSFNVPSGKTYSLVMAKKQGYTLADPEYTRRSFKYSASNPFYVVLEDENQRQADINAATKKVRRTLTAQLQKREDEIETLKEQNKMTEAEYQQKLQELYDNQSKSEQLVKEMAERYASTDYDQLDEFNQKVQMYIEEGELQKADSMIRSKGDIDKRVSEYHNVVEANKKVRTELERSEIGAAKTYEDLSQDLYLRHEIFMQEYKHDSALYCLKIRADLDTTNIEVVWDYAGLCDKQRKFEECKKYYFICLRSSTICGNISTIAKFQNNLGLLFRDLHDFQNSEKYLKFALENRERLFKQNPIEYRADFGTAQNNLGLLYRDLQDFQNSEKYLKSALENREILFNQNPDEYRADLGSTQNNLGVLYQAIRDFQNSEKYYQLALKNKEILFNRNPNEYRADLAATLHNLGNLYNYLHDYASSEKYLKTALSYREQLFNQNPDVYCADFAATLNSLGNLYDDLQDFQNSEKYYKHALEYKELLFKKNPDAYRSDLATIQNNLGILYAKQQNYASSEKYFKLTLENYEYLFNLYPIAYRSVLSRSQSNLGHLYSELHDYQNSEKFYKLALENYDILFEKDSELFREKIVEILNNLAYLYIESNRAEEAYTMINKAICMFPNNADIYDSKGEILLLQGKNVEALEMWKMVLELNPDFLKEYPDGTNLSNGLKKLGLIE